MVTKVLIFTGGVAVGLVIAKIYADSKIQGGIDSGLAAIGLGGGVVQNVADHTLVPIIQG